MRVKVAILVEDSAGEVIVEARRSEHVFDTDEPFRAAGERLAALMTDAEAQASKQMARWLEPAEAG